MVWVAIQFRDLDVCSLLHLFPYILTSAVPTLRHVGTTLFFLSTQLAFFFISVVNCSKVPVVENATYNASNVDFGANVTYVCKEGYLFPDKTWVTSIQCQADRTWTARIPHCQR